MDPITIGLAFSGAIKAVGYIKQAIALGKDVNSLAGQFSKFFEGADAIHREKIKKKAEGKRTGKSDAELGKEALDIAMHSDALRQAERELKDMIIWQLGKPQIWEQMIQERNRLFKERADAEEAEKERQLAHKKKMSELLLFSMYLFGFCFVLFALIMGGVGIYGMAEEKRIYEEKVIAYKKTLLIRQREREEEGIKARDKAVGGG
jgi:hypothetical protein